MVNAARIVARDHNLEIALALAPTLTQAELAEVGRADLAGIKIIESDTYNIVAASELAWSRQGPPRWRPRCSDAPRSSPTSLASTHFLGRMLVTEVDRIRDAEYPGGPADRAGTIQRDVTVEKLVRAAEPLLSETIRAETVSALKALRDKLGSPGAAGRVATIALEMIAARPAA